MTFLLAAWFIVPATVTNAITNGVHAVFLFCFFGFTLRQYLEKDPRFPYFNIVLAFLFMFVNKVLGVVVHYYYNSMDPFLYKLCWTSICLFTFAGAYCTLYSIGMPNWVRRVVMGITLLLGMQFIRDAFRPESNVSFFLIAITLFLNYLVAAYYLRGLARRGFLLVVGASIMWILARQIESLYIDLNIYVENTYDNDVFHIMLMLATSFLFFSFFRRDWIYPRQFRYF